jgi:hypothetical protein
VLGGVARNLQWRTAGQQTNPDLTAPVGLRDEGDGLAVR